MDRTASAAGAPDHAALMDSVYRGQRHIYDFTRKYYLFGRDRLIDELAVPTGGSVLEIGCGTGRNLAKVGRRWPGAKLHGLDLSNEMLKSAAATLGGDAALAQGDATGFSAAALFGLPQFDRVILSYALSMIPEWRAALDQASALLAPGGALHIVDFGDLDGLSAAPRAVLRTWLRWFHVTPREDLTTAASDIAARQGFSYRTHRGLFGYYRLITITRRV